MSLCRSIFPSDARSLWTYSRMDNTGIVEHGLWHGRGAPGLKPHFHDETQIVMVLSGSRSFLIGGITVTVKAGQGASIPAGMLHLPLATTANETICLNTYVAAGDSAQSLELFDIPVHWSREDWISVNSFSSVWHQIASGGSLRPAVKTGNKQLRATLANNIGSVGEIAARLGQSREGFSRRVSREVGISPHAFRVLTRLNMARHLLRDGHSIAAVAADTGFADQSHMTRLFRRTFGTTPGLYRRGKP